MSLFFRDGSELTDLGRVHDLNSAKPYIVRPRRCGKCGGQGYIAGYQHVEGGRCFQCDGNGRGPSETCILYTADKLAKLNATAAKRAASQQAKAAAKIAQAQAEATARRSAFEAKHADLLRWLNTMDLREGFLFDMRERAAKMALWSDAQVSALQAARARCEERNRIAAASQYVGSVGERLHNLTVTVEHVHEHMTTDFQGYNAILYITTMRDTSGNCIVVMSSSFRVAKGDRLSISGSVKEHSEFRGQLQTRLQRVKINAHVEEKNVRKNRPLPNF